MSKLLKTIAISSVLLSLTACPVQNSEIKQSKETKKLLNEIDKQLGMPDIVNYQEKRLAKQILELRDTEIATHTYIVNHMKGCLVYLGASVGYGLPYSVQYTNPMKGRSSTSNFAVPQADPNGLYMPQGLSATWVLLYNPKTKKTAPIYIESEITVSPFRITHQECRG